MVPYDGKNKPVRFSGMWETVVGSKIPYGICTTSPVRWFVNNRTGYIWICERAMPVGSPYGIARRSPDRLGWKYHTVYRALKKYPVRY